MQKVALKEKYVQIPNETAKAVEIKAANPISLTALGLITNLWSYDVEKWELHKTELYKRFAKNKKTAVSNAWDELVETNYIIEFKFRVGSSWEYVYIYRIEPFSKTEKEELLAQCVELYRVDSTSDFQLLKMGSSKRGVQNQHISNEQPNQDNIKEIQTNEKLNGSLIASQLENLPNIIKIDDDKKEPVQINDYAFKEFYDHFKENYPTTFDNEMFAMIYNQMQIQGLAIITENEAIDQYKRMEKIGREKIGVYAIYFVGGILLNRTSQTNALEKRKLKKEMDRLNTLKAEKEKEENKKPFPFYNWLEN